MSNGEDSKFDKNAPKAWADDVALMGESAPRSDGHIKFLIEYLLTVYQRFGNTAVTFNAKWGASALWKRDEQAKRIEELERTLRSAASSNVEELRTLLSNCDAKRDHNYRLGADSFTITTAEYAALKWYATLRFDDERRWASSSEEQTFEQWWAGAGFKQYHAVGGETVARAAWIASKSHERRSAQPVAEGPVYLVDNKPHRYCDCDPLTQQCPRGIKRAMETTQFSRCLLPVSDVFITPPLAKEQWCGAHITRVADNGLAYLESNGRLFPFTFDKIDGYCGEQPKKIGLREGVPVVVMLRADKIERVMLPRSPSSAIRRSE